MNSNGDAPLLLNYAGCLGCLLCEPLCCMNPWPHPIANYTGCLGCLLCRMHSCTCSANSISCTSLCPFMQRDFKINSLRAKTRYRITALRTGMKESIHRGLVELVGSEVLDYPVESLIQAIYGKPSENRPEVENAQGMGLESSHTKEKSPRKTNESALRRRASKQSLKSAEGKGESKEGNKEGMKGGKDENKKVNSIESSTISIENTGGTTPVKEKRIPGLRRYASEDSSVLSEAPVRALSSRKTGSAESRKGRKVTLNLKGFAHKEL